MYIYIYIGQIIFLPNSENGGNKNFNGRPRSFGALFLVPTRDTEKLNFELVSFAINVGGATLLYATSVSHVNVTCKRTEVLD